MKLTEDAVSGVGGRLCARTRNFNAGSRGVSVGGTFAARTPRRW